MYISRCMTVNIQSPMSHLSASRNQRERSQRITITSERNNAVCAESEQTAVNNVEKHRCMVASHFSLKASWYPRYRTKQESGERRVSAADCWFLVAHRLVCCSFDRQLGRWNNPLELQNHSRFALHLKPFSYVAHMRSTRKSFRSLVERFS